MKKIYILLFAALLTVSCAKQAGQERFITVEAGIGSMTKVEYTGDEAKFVGGDKISVFAWTGDASAIPATLVVDGVVNTFDGSKWTPASQMLWDDNSSKHYFLGVSPARTVTDFTADAYTLDPDDFGASDLMIAVNKEGLEPSGTPVALNFTHAMARLDVNLTFRNQWAAAPTVSAVTVKAQKSATVDYLSKLVTASGTGTAEAVALKSSENAAWSGLQVPQTGVNTITITIDGKDYVFTHTADIPLESGKYTVLNLAVGRDQIELSGEIKISNWTSQGAAIEGDAEEDPYNGHAYVDMGNGLKWATCNVGAENPEDYGDYVAWGETAPKAEYSWGTYQWMEAGQSSWTYITKYTFADGETDVTWTEGTWWYDGDIFKGDNGDGVDHKDFASYDYADDAARQNWGGNWRTPTDAEWTWLRGNCNWAWKTTEDGYTHNGMLVTSSVNGKQIFLPAAGYRLIINLSADGTYGYYWSSSLSKSNSGGAMGVRFYSGVVNESDDSRYYGIPVRPVSE